METQETPREFRDRNVKAATYRGLKALGLSRDEVVVEILNSGTRGVLGIGAEDAVVRLTPRAALPDAADLFRRGQEAETKDDRAEAIRLFEESLAVYVKLEDEAQIAKAQNRLAENLLKVGQLEEAKKHAQQGLEIEKRLGNLVGQHNNLMILRSIAMAEHDSRLVERLSEQIIMLGGMIKTERRKQANSLEAKVNDLIQQGEYQKALETLVQADNDYQGAFGFPDMLAHLYYCLGRNNEARAVLERLIPSRRANKDWGSYIRYELDLADIARDEGQHARAEELETESEKAVQQLENLGEPNPERQRFWVIDVPGLSGQVRGDDGSWGTDEKKSALLTQKPPLRGGDIALLCDPSAHALVGLGRVSEAEVGTRTNDLPSSQWGPRPRQEGVDRPEPETSEAVLFYTSVSLGEIEQAVPTLAKWQSQNAISAVTPAQWAVIRSLILYRNPDLQSNELPPTDMLPIYRFDVAETKMPTRLDANTSVTVPVILRNSGNVVWDRGASFDITHRWSVAGGASGEPPQTNTGVGTIPEAVPPGGAAQLDPPLVLEPLPKEPGDYQVTCIVANQVWHVERESTPVTVSVGQRGDRDKTEPSALPSAPGGDEGELVKGGRSFGMPRPLNDSPYLYGLHDPGGENVMADQRIPGWILFTEELGDDPNDQRGSDYSRWADQEFGIIARLNNGYEPKGTIPLSNRYADFATRCANFARNSRGCHIWIIGNEMNFAVERPGVEFDRSQDPPRLARPGEVIQPGMYANCYRQCRAAIKAVPGHEKDQVIVGGVAPWNPQTTYPGNTTGDWVKYLEDILTILGPTNCDGIAIHAYTHGADPKLIYTDAFMNAPFQKRQYNFRTYQDFMKTIPLSMRHLPVYLTETDQDDAWRNENNGWVQRAYREIDWWNRQPGNQVIRAVILYRWPNAGKWGIDGKAGVIEDFKQALANRYNWEEVLQSRAGEPSEVIGADQPAGQGSAAAKSDIGAGVSEEKRVRRFWLVPATVRVENGEKRCAWDIAFRDGSVKWTKATGADSQANIKSARDGDIVIAYRSTPDHRITGLGRIVGTPFTVEDQKTATYGVQIDTDLKLEQGVTLKELRQAVPELDHVQHQTRPSGFSPVTGEQWAVIRSLILYHNPDLLSSAVLPGTDIPPHHGFEIAEVKAPTTFSENAEIAVAIILRNSGNVDWTGGAVFGISHQWLRAGDTHRKPVHVVEETPGAISRLVPPGYSVSLALRPIKPPPPEPGDYEIEWIVTGTGPYWQGGPVSLTKHVSMRVSILRAPQLQVDELKLPSDETKPPVAEVKPPGNETRTSAAEVKPPTDETKPPADEVKPSSGETRPPANEVRPSADEAKPPSGETKPPTNEVKPPTDESKPAAVEAKEPSGETRLPAEVQKAEAAPSPPKDEEPVGAQEPWATPRPAEDTDQKTITVQRVDSKQQSVAFPQTQDILLDEIRPWPPTPEAAAASPLAQLRVDAAVPEWVQVNKSFALAVSVRQPYQPRLSLADLSQVESGAVSVEWPEDKLAVTLRVEVSAPECAIHGEARRTFRLPRSGQSPTFVFQLTPTVAGTIEIVVNVYQQDEWLGSANVHTEACEQLAGKVEVKVKSAPVLQAPPEYGSRQTIVMPTLVMAEKRREDTINPHTLDIHLTPRADTAKYKYQVLLQFRTPSENALKVFEGPLALPDDIERMGLGEEYGKALFDALFNMEVNPGPDTTYGGYNQIKGQAEEADGLRFQIRINSEAAWLHTLGWEYLCDQKPLGCQPKTPLARVLHVSTPAYRLRQVDGNHPLRILAAVASPSGLKRVGLDPILPSEFRSLAADIDHIRSLLGNVVESLESAGNLVHSPDDKVSLALLRDRLSNARTAGRPVNVLHLFCHGYVSQDSVHCLVLHAEGRPGLEYVSDQDFATGIAEFVARGGTDGLRLVVLASCLSADVSNRRALRGVARELVAAGIPAVVAMAGEMEFEAGRRFAQRLYAHLMTTGEVDSAVNVARSELYQRRGMGPRDERQGRVSADQYGVPVLFMNIPDGKLFDKNPGLPQFSTRAQPLERFSTEDTQALKDAALGAAAERLSGQLGAPAAGLAQQFIDLLRQTQTAHVPPPMQRPRLFEQPGQVANRRALIEAAALYRGRSWRRTVLFLRGEVRRTIAGQLKKGRLTELSKMAPSGAAVPPEEVTQFWQRIRLAGTVRRGGALEVAIGGCGPSGAGPLADASLSEWRASLLGFKRDSGENCADIVTLADDLTGNLTWQDDTAGDPSVAIADVANLLRLLYDGQDGVGDPFEAFGRLTKGHVPSHTASLLLHALADDQCVPYTEDLAGDVLAALGLTDDPAYGKGFGGYCKLTRDLLADDDLEFDDLADVSFFLQRLATGKETLEAVAVKRAERLDSAGHWRRPLHPVALTEADLDCGLVLHSHALEQAAAALNAGKHIILLGPPGTGKTTLAEDLCRSAHDLGCNHGHILVTATGDWTTFDTIGGYMPRPNNQLIFRPGIFLKAIEAGKWLVIDEINRADIDKAFGELFTVLSNQVVTLPYVAEDGRPVRILPPDKPRSEQTYDYVIDPSWRIIGTMNVYDKASLFSMSLAFMRRFAFIDVAIPHPAAYRRLILSLLRDAGGAASEVEEPLRQIFQADEKTAPNELMRWRALGPAIACDLIRYLRERSRGQKRGFNRQDLIEALLLYVVPQFEGLERISVLDVYRRLCEVFQKELTSTGEDSHIAVALLERIEELFPFVPANDWKREPPVRTQ